MASATEIKQIQLPNNTTKYDLIAKNGIFYIEGTGTTDTTNKVATWTGTHNDITEYYNGLTVAYKISTAGSTTTTLNINNLGAVPVVRNVTTGVSTAYAVNSLILLTYTVDGSTAYWKIADYDANTKTSSGSSEKTATKLFLVGATSQSSSGVTTYSNKLCYVGTDNCLYSNGAKVCTSDTNTTYTLSGAASGSTWVTTLTPSSGSATTSTVPAATQSAAGLMTAADKKKLDGIAAGATANTGDITGVTAGNGLTDGGTSGSVTLNVGAGVGIAVAADAVKAKLRSETALTVDSAAATTTSGRVYPVAVDKTGYLAVNVPWTDTNTQAVSSVNGKTGAVSLTYSDVSAAADSHNHAASEITSGTLAAARLPAATSTTLGGVKIGDNINVSSGTISVSAANTSTVGVAKLYKAEDCTGYTSDDGGATPAAVKKAVSLFGIPRDSNTKYTSEDITLINSSQANQGSQPKIHWKTIGENTPFIGFATDQSDGTFVLASLKGTNYASGLAIGGGSGNLLWKGTKVATVSDIVTYSAITNAQIDAICNASISNLSEVNF